MHIEFDDYEFSLETKDLTPREILEQAHTHLLPEAAWVSQSWFGWDQLAPAQGTHQACSVGAMLLANTLDIEELRHNDIEDDLLSIYLESDPNFRIALQYLAMVISEYHPTMFRLAWASAGETMPGAAETWARLGACHGSFLIALVVNWNDDDNRTHDQVLNLFERAIKLAVADEELTHG